MYFFCLFDGFEIYFEIHENIHDIMKETDKNMT